MVAHQVGARAWHQGSEASDEVEWLEQHVSGTVAERMLERVDNQPIAVDAQPLECDGPARDVAAKTLEFVTLMVCTGMGST
jgi:hypothetical protein